MSTVCRVCVCVFEDMYDVYYNIQIGFQANIYVRQKAAAV